MCGFSAAFPRDSQQLLYISAPGIYYWQGGTFAQSTRDPKIRPNTPDSHGDHDNNMLGKSLCLPANRFLGYSSASGDFNGDNLDDIVMGVPRGNELIGMVR
jgi:integrin alpha 8